MVGLNLSGIVSGSELRQVTQEIFGKAQGFTPKQTKASKEETQAQIANLGNKGISKNASKASRNDFKQNKDVQMGEDIMSSIKSQSAIDRYGQIDFKNPNAHEFDAQMYPELATAEQILNAYGAKKDKEGKNPFTLFKPEAQEEKKEMKTEWDLSQSIFSIKK